MPFSALSERDFDPESEQSENEETAEKTGVFRAVSAERGGFEPPVEGIPRRRFSKAVLSATQPPLRLRGSEDNYIS